MNESSCWIDLLTNPRVGRILFWGYLAALSYLLLTPEPLWFLYDGPATHQRIDAGLHPFLQHVTAFTLLGLVWVHRRMTGEQRVGVSLNWMAGLVLYCAGVELAQYWIPERFFEGLDMLANLLGAALGVVLAHWIHRRLRLTVAAVSQQ